MLVQRAESSITPNISPGFIQQQRELKVFELLWFEECMSEFAKNGYVMEYTNSIFVSRPPNDILTEFKIEVTTDELDKSNKIAVTVPFSNNTEYKTTFTNYYKASQYLLYHLNDYKKNNRA